MTDHTPERAAEITAAARAAGAHDPSEMLALIPPAEMVNASDAVAKIKAEKPHFFKKQAALMTPAEFGEAKRETIREVENERQENAQSAFLKSLSRKYQNKDSK